MPQKTKRQKIRAARRPLNVPTTPIRHVESATSDKAEMQTYASESMPPTRAPAGQFTYDYSYVYRDLRRIAILTVSFFVLLIALYFVLPMIYK